MKVKGVFEAQVITRINGPPVAVYPVGPVTPGVGIQTTGKYVMAPHACLSGFFSYSRTNAYADSLGRLHGIGTLNLQFETTTGHRVTAAIAYTNRTVNPAEPFSVDRIDAFVTGASYDGKLATGTVQFEPIEGGRKYKIRLCLVPACN